MSRLHREALKQSATDPISGKIDVGILTTGLSAAARKRRGEITGALRKMLLAKQPRPPSMLQAKLLQELNQASQIVSSNYLLIFLYIFVKSNMNFLPASESYTICRMQIHS